jgi:hypothetical protein
MGEGGVVGLVEMGYIGALLWRWRIRIGTGEISLRAFSSAFAEYVRW